MSIIECITSLFGLQGGIARRKSGSGLPHVQARSHSLLPSIICRKSKSDNKTTGLLSLPWLNSVSNKILLTTGFFPPISAYCWPTYDLYIFLLSLCMLLYVMIVCLHIFAFPQTLSSLCIFYLSVTSRTLPMHYRCLINANLAYWDKRIITTLFTRRGSNWKTRYAYLHTHSHRNLYKLWYNNKWLWKTRKCH